MRGCDPKKILVGAAELVDRHNRMKGGNSRAGEHRLGRVDGVQAVVHRSHFCRA